MAISPPRRASVGHYKTAMSALVVRRVVEKIRVKVVIRSIREIGGSEVGRWVKVGISTSRFQHRLGQACGNTKNLLSACLHAGKAAFPWATTHR